MTATTRLADFILSLIELASRCNCILPYEKRVLAAQPGITPESFADASSIAILRRIVANDQVEITDVARLAIALPARMTFNRRRRIAGAAECFRLVTVSRFVVTPTDLNTASAREKLSGSCRGAPLSMPSRKVTAPARNIRPVENRSRNSATRLGASKTFRGPISSVSAAVHFASRRASPAPDRARFREN